MIETLSVSGEKVIEHALSMRSSGTKKARRGMTAPGLESHPEV